MLVFKGGTAIRKVYFPEWRLSEDLDFTIPNEIEPQKLRQTFELMLQLLKGKSGIDYSLKSFTDRKFGILADVQFLGPLGFKNRIAHDISLKEKMIEQAEWRTINPEYREISEFEIQVYSLNEILVEKIRGIFQRGKARDYYDVWRMMKQKEFDVGKIRELLIRKCEITGIKFQPELVFDKTRLSEAKKFWVIALVRLTKDLPDFDKVVSELKDMLSFLEE